MYTTVQDHGRFLGAHLGIPISGPMDRQSAEIANLMLENEISDALLECTFIGPKIIFHASTSIVIRGADVITKINDQEIDTHGIIQIQPEDTLSFGRVARGCRWYIALKGGIKSEKIFGSQSVCTIAGILDPLKNGDQLNYESYPNKINSQVSIKRTIRNTLLRAYKGPEFSILSEHSSQQLFDTQFTILPQSNRMAYRVTHDLDLTHAHSMLSSGTLPGTVQLTPSGDIICLMRDTQSTGGYPRILQLTEDAICDLTQLRPNQHFNFQLTP